MDLETSWDADRGEGLLMHTRRGYMAGMAVMAMVPIVSDRLALSGSLVRAGL